MQSIILASIAVLAAPAFWTANDPFVGHWVLDVSRSTIVDQMRVEALPGSRFRFSFEGGPAETILADGTDQPGLPGTTLAVRTGPARTMTVIRKQDGRVIVSANWQLSEHGSILSDAFTGLQPDGSTMTVKYLYRRVSGTSGFAGVWESTTKPIGLRLELGIKPFDGTGLTFASGGSDKNVTFDGQPHAVPGKTDGLIFSGQRSRAHALQYSETIRGKVERVRWFQISPDGGTLTETLRTAGQKSPDIFVFQRE